MSTLQKIAELEAEYAKTQKNKATNFHLGLIKAKLAKLRRELIEPQGGGGGKGGEGFDVAKSGDTRVGLVGFPSVGKSTLLTKLTGTFSEAAAYEFTTLTAIPGTLHYRGAKIQVRARARVCVCVCYGGGVGGCCHCCCRHAGGVIHFIDGTLGDVGRLYHKSTDPTNHPTNQPTITGGGPPRDHRGC